MSQNSLPIHEKIVRDCIDWEGFVRPGIVKEIDSCVLDNRAGEVLVF